MPARHFTLTALALLLALLLALGSASCSQRPSRGGGSGGAVAATPQKDGLYRPSERAELFRSALVEPAERGKGRAYFSIRDSQGLNRGLHDYVGQRLALKGFSVTDKPSEADRIVEIAIVARGRASQASLEACVRQGYAGSAALEAGDRGAIVADVLLVRRRAHVEGAKAHLKNISARNAVSSTKLRIAALGSEKALKGRDLEFALAEDIAGLASSSEDMQRHKTRSSTEVRQDAPAKSPKEKESSAGRHKNRHKVKVKVNRKHRKRR
ncbi:MAG: hypothetical protein II515_08535 [Desulfovibrio sp.]|nr:hypothetical protein [Desulfovibrio sp.]